MEGSVWLHASVYAFFPAVFALALCLSDAYLPSSPVNFAGTPELGKSHVWTGTTSVLVLVVLFRTKQALARFWEGTTLLHQMKGEFFDSVSNLVAFTCSMKNRRAMDVLKFRGIVVRLMSLIHASALEEIAGTEERFTTIDVFGIDMDSLCVLKEFVESHNFNKVEALVHMFRLVVTQAGETGVLDVPAPILSRVYQTLSRGYVNLLNAKKITDTKFPFPYVQLIAVLFILQSAMAPAIFASSGHVVLAPVCTFLYMFGLHALNLIAIQLEDPFGTDTNDLPLADFQREMNICLLMLLHPGCDKVPQINDTAACVAEDHFEELKETVLGKSAAQPFAASKRSNRTWRIGSEFVRPSQESMPDLIGAGEGNGSTERETVMSRQSMWENAKDFTPHSYKKFVAPDRPSGRKSWWSAQEEKAKEESQHDVSGDSEFSGGSHWVSEASALNKGSMPDQYATEQSAATGELSEKTVKFEVATFQTTLHNWIDKMAGQMAFIEATVDQTRLPNGPRQDSRQRRQTQRWGSPHPDPPEVDGPGSARPSNNSVRPSATSTVSAVSLNSRSIRMRKSALENSSDSDSPEDLPSALAPPQPEPSGGESSQRLQRARRARQRAEESNARQAGASALPTPAAVATASCGAGGVVSFSLAPQPIAAQEVDAQPPPKSHSHCEEVSVHV